MELVFRTFMKTTPNKLLQHHLKILMAKNNFWNLELFVWPQTPFEKRSVFSLRKCAQFFFMVFFNPETIQTGPFE